MVKEVISYIKASFPWKYLLIATFRLKKPQEGLDSLEILANIYFSFPKLRSITFGIRLIWWVISLTPALFSLAPSDLSFSQNEACKKAGFHHPGWFSVAQRWQTLLLCKKVEVISSVLNTGIARNLKDAVIGLSRRHWTMNVCLLSVCKSRWFWIKPRHALLQTKKDCVFLTSLEGTTPTNLPILTLLRTLIERESGSNRRSSKSVSQVKTESCKRSFLECLEKLSHLENRQNLKGRIPSYKTFLAYAPLRFWVQLNWGPFLKSPGNFSRGPESQSKISNRTTTEMFYLQGLNMNRSSLPTKSIRRMHFSVLRCR